MQSVSHALVRVCSPLHHRNRIANSLYSSFAHRNTTTTTTTNCNTARPPSVAAVKKKKKKKKSTHDHNTNSGNSNSSSSSSHCPQGVRLQKVLARAGFGSRRACEVLITSGRVSVDGTLVTELGLRVDPSNVSLNVDGTNVQLSEQGDCAMVTFAFHKPSSVVSAMKDPQGRRNLSHFVKEIPSRVFHVGRLDYETEGLLLLTNDGELSHRLMHPSYQVSKTYLIEVAGPVPSTVDTALQKGVELEDGPAAADTLCRIRETKSRVVFEMSIHEGRNRIVRRMFDTVGCPVLRLTRTKIGPISLGQLRSGQLRKLSADELSQLKTMVGML